MQDFSKTNPNDIEALMNFMREHHSNVMRSLYVAGDDDNPIRMDDTIRAVARKMGFGVRADCHPEILKGELEAVEWALDNGVIDEFWPEYAVMKKEVEVFARSTSNKQSHFITKENMAEQCNVDIEDIEFREGYETGMRMVWLGAVLMQIAKKAYVFRNNMEDISEPSLEPNKLEIIDE